MTRKDDTVGKMLLGALGDEIIAELGPDTGFMLFVDWHDDKPGSYLSNIPRSQALELLDDWLQRREGIGESFAAEERPLSPLERQCAALSKQMSEEDIGVFLFLATSGPGGEIAYCSTIREGRRVVEHWVKSERKRS